ncbi:MAG: ABC transporter permease, partial [Gammaproteobacteria bacterium]
MNARLVLPAMILIFWAVLAGGSFFLSLHPDDLLLSRILAGPADQAWLGYDDLGRPIADRVIMGARTSLYVSLCVTLLSLLLGSVIGVFAGWLGGWWDRVAVLVIDIFIAFPGILLAIALAGLLGPGIMNAVIALSVVGWVGFARLARAQTLAVKQREHVIAAIA